MQGNMTYHLTMIVVALLFGVGGLIRGLQMLFQGRLDLISDWDSRPLPNPAEYAKSFATVYISLGIAVLFVPLLILLGIPLLFCGIILAVLVWYWFQAIDKIAARAREAKDG